MSKGLTVQEALEKAELIDRTLSAFIQTAPRTFCSPEAVAALSEMTCVGPIPRLDAATWQAACLEYEARRNAHA